MYKSLLVTDSVRHRTIEHIFLYGSDGSSYVTFANEESNDGPERKAFLAWVAEGGTPEVIEP